MRNLIIIMATVMLLGVGGHTVEIKNNDDIYEYGVGEWSVCEEVESSDGIVTGLVNESGVYITKMVYGRPVGVQKLSDAMWDHYDHNPEVAYEYAEMLNDWADEMGYND